MGRRFGELRSNNCLLTGNYASYAGGASYYGPLNNCTIVGNSVATGPGTYGGGGVYDGSVNNCIIYYNNGGNCGADYPGAVSLNHCCTDAGGLDNISNPPLFVNMAGSDFHLQTNSPCINSGNNAFVAGTNDLDGLPRIVGGTVDIGAYEYQTPTSVISYAWLQQYGFAHRRFGGLRGLRRHRHEQLAEMDCRFESHQPRVRSGHVDTGFHQ